MESKTDASEQVSAQSRKALSLKEQTASTKLSFITANTAVISTTSQDMSLNASLSASMFFSTQNNNSKLRTFRFGGTQTFSLRQLWPIKAYIFSKKCLARNEKPLFAGEKAIISLGVGANMVKSIYYWAQCLNILDDQAQSTPFAEYLFGNVDDNDYLSVDEVAAFSDDNMRLDYGLDLYFTDENKTTTAIHSTTTTTAINHALNDNNYITNKIINIEKLSSGGGRPLSRKYKFPLVTPLLPE